MLAALAYIRVSSKEQGKRGFGLAAQEAEIARFAQARGYRIVRIFKEVGSALAEGNLAKREQLRTLLQIARKHDFPIIVTRLDRLARISTELEALVRRSGITVMSIDSYEKHDPAVLEARSARIQIESEMLKKRTLEGLARAKQRGVKFGNPTNLPEAQKKGAKANQEAALARSRELDPIILEIRESGTKTMADIAEQLNQRGLRTARGQKWTEANVRRVIRKIDQNNQNKNAADESYVGRPGFGVW